MLSRYISSRQLVIILSVIMSLMHARFLYSQDDPCSKPKVWVRSPEVFNEVYELLNETSPEQPGDEWYAQIEDWVLAELNKNSPATQFIPDCGDDCDYCFSYSIAVIGAGESIKIDEDVYSSEYTAFFMHSELDDNNSCGIQSRKLDVEITQSFQDLFPTIESNIGSYGNIGARIDEQENEHRVPPRGPAIELSKNRDYVSPLEDEREIDIKIDVKNCREEPVYDRYHGQLVFLPKHTDRGELECTEHFSQVCRPDRNLLTIEIQEPAGASATYSLEEGIEPGSEQIKITTCGREKKAREEVEIRIMGLELEVRPRKKEIKSGEQVEIDVTFNKVDPGGVKIPVPNKAVQLNIRGLIDGNVTPASQVTTDNKGQAILTYLAGERDTLIIIQAKYQPADYPEYVEATATVCVTREWNWSGSLIMERTERFNCEISEKENKLEKVLDDLEYKKQTAMMNLYSADFDMGSGMAIQITDDMKAGGNFNCELKTETTINSDHLSTTCRKDNQYFEKSPGNYIHRFEQSSGNASCLLTEENLVIVCSGDVGGIDDLANQLKDGKYDMSNIGDFLTQMQDATKEFEDKESPDIKIEVQLHVMCNGQVSYSRMTETYQACPEEKVDDSDDGTAEMPLGFPQVCDFKGLYIKGEKGDDRIEGTFDTTYTVPHGQGDRGFKTEECPEIQVNERCLLKLSRKPD